MFPRTQEKTGSFDEEYLGAAGLTAFFNLTEQWGLSPEQERILLGNPPRSTFYKWKKARAGRLNQDTLERISYLLGIYKALQILLPSTQAANEWLKKPNKAPLFGGRPALDRMLGGRVIDLADVRRYLDGWRG
jgi:hypothetical protein